MDLHDWNDLVTERAAIMEHCGGMPEPMARGKAWVDTVLRFGEQPGNAPRLTAFTVVSSGKAVNSA